MCGLTHLGELPSGLSQDAWHTRRKDDMVAEQTLARDAALRGAPFLGQSIPLTPRLFCGTTPSRMRHEPTSWSRTFHSLRNSPRRRRSTPLISRAFTSRNMALGCVSPFCVPWGAPMRNNAGHARAVFTCMYLSGANIGFQYGLQEIRPPGTLPFYAEGEHTGLLLGSQLYMSWLVDEDTLHRMLGQLVQFDTRPAEGWWETEFGNLPPEA